VLRDPARATFAWVMLPEALALEESRDAVAARGRARVHVAEIVVNRVIPLPPGPCRLCRERRRSEAGILAQARRSFPGLPLRVIAARDDEPRGVDRLRRVAPDLLAAARAQPAALARAPRGRRPEKAAEPSPAAPWWLSLVAPPSCRLLVFGGKGGVGKTSAAAAAALTLARHRPEARVLLLSADPAHSLGDALEARLGDDERRVPRAPPRLRARELDADRALAAARDRYREAVDQLFDALRGRAHLDPAFDRAVVHDLIALAPPGIDELFAMAAVTDALSDGTPEAPAVVVLDTAPTGHALRLLALPGAAREWVQALISVLLKYRDVVGLGRLAQELVEMSRQLRALEALLRDPARAGFVAVTRPGDLPRRETERLLDELGGLGIPVAALLVNAMTPPGCARCRRAAAREEREVRALGRGWRSLTGPDRPMILAPMTAPEPRGVRPLQDWGGTWRRFGSAAPA
jgi:arsenite-transporting ATPase